VEHYYHVDHLGTSQRLTNAQGETTWRMVSEAFGKTFVDTTLAPTTTGTTTNNFRFPGQYEDQETGTYYNYFRDYDPITGRYVQSDPIGLAGGLSTYTYVEGNPISYTDPTGEIIFAPKGALIGAGLNIFTQLLMNGGNFRCIEWDVVGIAAVTGALNPFSGLAAANSALKAERQWARSESLRQGSSAARRAAQRGDKHNANSWTEAASWAGVAGGSTIAGKLIPDEQHIRIGSDCECRQ
jgi:RHS repeat-associated protein